MTFGQQDDEGQPYFLAFALDDALDVVVNPLERRREILHLDRLNDPVIVDGAFCHCLGHPSS